VDAEANLMFKVSSLFS